MKQIAIPGTIHEGLTKADKSLGALWTPQLNYVIASDHTK